MLIQLFHLLFVDFRTVVYRTGYIKLIFSINSTGLKKCFPCSIKKTFKNTSNTAIDKIIFSYEFFIINALFVSTTPLKKYRYSLFFFLTSKFFQLE